MMAVQQAPEQQIRTWQEARGLGECKEPGGQYALAVQKDIQRSENGRLWGIAAEAGEASDCCFQLYALWKYLAF